MSEQIHKDKQTSKAKIEATEAEGLSEETKQRVDAVKESTDDLTDEIDALLEEEELDLLDEIDSVLEENAQAFVDGFIQKGGQ